MSVYVVVSKTSTTTVRVVKVFSTESTAELYVKTYNSDSNPLTVQTHQLEDYIDPTMQHIAQGESFWKVNQSFNQAEGVDHQKKGGSDNEHINLHSGDHFVWAVDENEAINKAKDMQKMCRINCWLKREIWLNEHGYIW